MTLHTDKEIADALRRHIAKLEKWCTDYIEGNEIKEDTRKPPLMPIEVWQDQLEEVYEHRSNLMMKLKFFIDYPEREMSL